MNRKEYYQINKETIKVQNKTSYHKYKNKHKKRRSNYYFENKDRIKEINHLNRVRRNFGLAPEEYASKILSQNGQCAICKEKPKKRLCVDHNHKTGKVRGMLCSRCNTTIGFMKDDISVAEAALEYLRMYE